MDNKSSDVNNILISIAIVIILITFGVRASNNMIGTTMPLLAKKLFNFNNTKIGLLATIFMGFTFIMSNFINTKIKSKTRKKLFIISSIIYTLTFPLFYMSNQITIWLVAALAGFTIGALMPNLITSAGLFEDRRIRERMLAIYSLSLSTSLLIGPAIEGFILRYYTLRQSFLFFTIISALVPVLSPFLRFPDEDHESKIDTSFGKILKNNGFKVALLNNLTYQVPFAFILTFDGIYAENVFHASNSIAILLYSVFFITSFLGRLLLAIRPPSNIKLLIETSVTLTIIGLIVAFLSPNIYIFVVALLILGIPHGFTYTLSIITLSRTFDINLRNAANSYFFSTMMVIGAILPSLLGILVDITSLRIGFIAILPIIIAVFYVTEIYSRKTKELKVY
ncbi:arabinose efflux permease family protein [Caldisphaera lagunensis DSM 15908]|uniref:Arabinose efflux permease family protein n=1 Tax=Caldisphaera lagunensis (strain DSM 15908 / JCM 11604 / ANMR 0165 / IC-154) TaxID=1056495 RepID=L0A851_CALLD|nr:MFS transporter [Caldisphaera lagunensis]AFZ70048.1 arabinose efflux permease family protein [Caldisphaera lagunensis DSM 15908]